MAAAAQHLGMSLRLVESDDDDERLVNHSRWALMARQAQWFEQALLSDAQPVAVGERFRPWTDDYSSLLSVIR